MLKPFSFLKPGKKIKFLRQFFIIFRKNSKENRLFSRFSIISSFLDKHFGQQATMTWEKYITFDMTKKNYLKDHQMLLQPHPKHKVVQFFDQKISNHPHMALGRFEVGVYPKTNCFGS